MNTLSWLIYLADVAFSANAVALFGLVVFTLIGGTSFIVSGDRGYSYEQDYIAEKRARFKKVSQDCVKLLVVCTLILVLVPTRQTIMFIAASEAGEELAQTETAGKAVQALNKYLDEFIKEDQ